MVLKKIDDVSRSAQIYEEELEQEEILVKVGHVSAELHNPNEVKEEAGVPVIDDETDNDYLLARDRQRRVIKPPQRLSYAYPIIFTLISTSEVLDEEPRDCKETVRSRNKT